MDDMTYGFRKSRKFL